ncbi:MAG: phosphatase PAP2 family protein [Hyphomicrobiaceae bacterium]
MRFLEIRTARFSLLLLAVFLAVDAVWLAVSPLYLERTSTLDLLKGGLAILACVALLKAIEWRLKDDDSQVAGWLRYVSQGTLRLAPAVAVMLYLASSLVALSYLAASTAFPFQDAKFVAMDEALGFDWLGWLAVINSHVYIAKTLSFAYFTQLVVVQAVLVLLAFTNQIEEMWAFVVQFALAAVGAILISMVIPAIGATEFHATSSALLSNLDPLAGRYHLETFLGLRSGQVNAIDFEHAKGLVTFPSFHTAMAILTTYAVRKIRWAFWPMAVLNALIIVSTLHVGGHYFVDLLGGGVLMLAVIWLVRRIEVRKAPAHSIQPALA